MIKNMQYVKTFSQTCGDDPNPREKVLTFLRLRSADEV
jgi:hypothetical protein